METKNDDVTSKTLECRPYQLMCMLCRLGAGDPVERLADSCLNEIFKVIRENPRIRLRFISYAGNKWGGVDEDSPCGVLFHMRQDEKILACKRKGLSSAKAGLGALEAISGIDIKVEDICWFDPEAKPVWRGCPLADENYFTLGRDRLKELISNIVPDYNGTKTQKELDSIKTESAKAVLKSDVIRLFPSHLAYVVVYAFQYEDREAKPVCRDNLWEPAEAMRRNPEIPVMLVPDYCMVCPPCGGYDDGSGLCRLKPLNMNPVEKIRTMSIVGQLSVLRSLGLEFYQKIPSHRLLRLAKERLTADHYLFNYDGAPPNYHAFSRTLEDGLGFLDVFDDMEAVVQRVESLLVDERVVALLPDYERELVETTLARAKRDLADGKRKEAYLALAESVFAHIRKQYMERIPANYARLPDTIPVESEDAFSNRTLTARQLKRFAEGEEVFPQGFSTGFTTIINVHRPAIAETGVRIGYDQDNLCVEFVCADADDGALKAEARLGQDLENVGRRYDRWVDDAVLFVVHSELGNNETFLFTVNPKGVKLGEKAEVQDGRKTRGEWIRETEWNAEAGDADGFWRAKVTIPLGLFGGRFPYGETWAMNAHRFFRHDVLDHHSWAPMTVWNMYDSAQCGRLAFD